MQFLIIFAVAVGACSASPRFLQNTPEVQQATLDFIREYNRLAKLAAEAPDIHIYRQDDLKLQQLDSAPVPQQHHHVVRQPNPLVGQEAYQFTANLGTNQQFQPSQIQSFHQRPAVQSFRQQPAAQSFHQQPAVQSFRQQPAVHHVPAFDLQPATQIHQPRWTGPLADTVPAGVQGLPQQVTYSPEVAAARNAHFQVLNQAYQAAASRTHNTIG